MRAESHARPVVFRTQTMGTWASLTIVTPDSAALANTAYEALRAFHRVDSLMSNWTDISEVARINREAAPHEITVQPEVADVIGFAQQVTRESGGAFDITVEPLVRLWGFIGGTPRVPTEDDIDWALERVGPDKLRFNTKTRSLHFIRDGVKIDLGGIAKGYGVDQAADVLRQSRVRAVDFLIDLSGNMIGRGHSANTADGWWVGIRDPAGSYTDVAARILIQDEAVATSGDYEQFVDADGERYGHILDPRTGWSASGLASVTVVTDRAIAADAWSTALFVLGAKAARHIAQNRDDLSVVLIEPREDGLEDTSAIIWVEEALRARFELREDLEATFTVRYF
jgi:thiamine biosynthesis lipoprotein